MPRPSNEVLRDAFENCSYAKREVSEYPPLAFADTVAILRKLGRLLAVLVRGFLRKTRTGRLDENFNSEFGGDPLLHARQP